MSTWIPILTGILAFAGALAGHFVAFDLNAAAKRREVRRAQIERFAEYVSEDTTWMNDYKNDMLFASGNALKGTAPSDRALAIYMLYFGSELVSVMKELVEKRHEYEQAINEGHRDRIAAAIAGKTQLSSSLTAQATLDAVAGKYRGYYRAILACLNSASEIAQESIPEDSQIKRWCADKWARISRQFSHRHLTLNAGAIHLTRISETIS